MNNRHDLEYHVVVTIRRLRTDENCPAVNSWPNLVKMNSISDLRRPTAQKQKTKKQ